MTDDLFAVGQLPQRMLLAFKSESRPMIIRNTVKPPNTLSLSQSSEGAWRCNIHSSSDTITPTAAITKKVNAISVWPSRRAWRYPRARGPTGCRGAPPPRFHNLCILLGYLRENHGARQRTTWVRLSP